MVTDLMEEGCEHATNAMSEEFNLVMEEFAEQLVGSHATAKTHVARILAKLDARDRAQLVVLAYESGLVRPGLT